MEIVLFYMQHADMRFQQVESKDSKWLLSVKDIWTQIEHTLCFENEITGLHFVGEYLLNTDGPTEEFERLLPEFC